MKIIRVLQSGKQEKNENTRQTLSKNKLLLFLPDMNLPMEGTLFTKHSESKV